MMAIGDRSSPEKSSSPNGIWLIRELSLDRAVGQPAPRPQRTLVGAAPAHSCRPVRPVFGLCCRWLDGVIRQQCVGHLPFERRATANGGFSVLPTGTTDPERSLRLPQSCRSGTQGFHEFRCSEAAVRDLTHPAISCPSSSPQSCHPDGRWASKPVIASSTSLRCPHPF